MTWSSCYLTIVFQIRLASVRKGIFGEIFCIHYTVNLGGGCLWDNYKTKWSKCYLIIVFLLIFGNQRPPCCFQRPSKANVLVSFNNLITNCCLLQCYNQSLDYLIIILQLSCNRHNLVTILKLSFQII